MDASYWVGQIGRELPMFLVLLMGAIVAIVYMSRAPLAATLVLVGAGVLFLTNLFGLIGFSMLNKMELHQLGPVLSILIGIVRALAVAAFIGAAFAGRNEVPAGPPHKFSP